MNASAGPLHGITVVDISSSYAAPTTSMYLGDMGAEIIKIEPVRGDDARGWGPPFLNGEAAWFLSVNRNKKSLCLDIRGEQGREVLFRLLETADVFIENLNPAKLERHGLGLDALRERFPRLVICALSGFGLDGPDAALPGYDLIAQARSGMMSVTGDAGVPQRVSTALSDVAAGTVAAYAIAAALVRQQRHDVGEIIDVALLEADLAFMSPGSPASSRAIPNPAPAAAPTRWSRSTRRSGRATAPSSSPWATTRSGSTPARHWAWTSWPSGPTWPPTPDAARAGTRSSTPSSRC